ncbi:hypothetical protein SALBM311S_06177 [Streptomyces alboniger]
MQLPRGDEVGGAVQYAQHGAQRRVERQACSRSLADEPCMTMPPAMLGTIRRVRLIENDFHDHWLRRASISSARYEH